jgi:glutamyl/glutaminyl-tRNA synthetase
MTDSYRTRIAPSPTGVMHIGTARTALFNWLAARATGGRFILRIDDTDDARNDPAHVQVIKDSLDWLGLDYDSVIHQSCGASRLLAVAQANLLVDVGLATVLDNGAVALNWHPDMPTSWVDTVSGDHTITQDSIDKTITGTILIRGGDNVGKPTYHWNSVCDDHAMGINYIIRGNDHITNTDRQVAMWWALNQVTDPQPLPKFAHVSLIFKDKKKLSKRDGAASLLHYRDAGYHPNAIFGFLLGQGWGRSDGNTKHLMTRDDALAMFLDGGNFTSKVSTGFDQSILDSLDRKWKSRDEIATRKAVDDADS